MDNLLSMTAKKLGKAIKEGRLSVREVVSAYLNAIEKTDKKIGAYLTVNGEQALQNADRIQKKITDGEMLSALAGVPICIKDNICTENIATTCASKMLEGFIPPYSATAVNRLEQAGAIILGKMNMDEFAMGSTTETSYFKTTKNPWELSRVPGGSSGGCAAAVASCEAVCGLGSDTGGSVRQPAAYCGVTGFKPTYGLVSRYGLIAYASSFDQIGPIARDVCDCAAIMDIIKGKDALDSTSIDINKNLSEALNGNIKGIRLGVPTEFFEADGLQPEVAKRVSEALDVLKTAGACLVPISLSFLKYVIPTYYILATAQASSNLSRYDGIRFGIKTDADNLDELYKSTRSEGFGKEAKHRILLGTFVLSKGYYDKYYLKALKARSIINDGFNSAFETVDAIVCPTSPTTAPFLGESIKDPIKMYLSDAFTAIASLVGLPALSVPCGFDNNGLPVGAQIIGPRFKDDTVLNIGYTYQQYTDFHSQWLRGDAI